jgi:hypothetical protein
MRRFLLTLTIALSTALCLPLAAQAAFGFEEVDVTFTNANGSPMTQAGAHPFAMKTTIGLNTVIHPTLGQIPDEAIKDLTIGQIPGFVGNPTAVPRCSTLDFLTNVGGEPHCPLSTQVGIANLAIGGQSENYETPVFNLVPPPGVAAKIGFLAVTVPVTVELGVNPNPPYNVVAQLSNIPQIVPLFRSEVTIWGNPASAAHDPQRRNCIGNCSASFTNKPFLTVPRACEGPLRTDFEADSWPHPSVRVTKSSITHDSALPPNPTGFSGCGKLGFNPSITAKPTTLAAQSPTGLDFSLDVNDEGLTNPDGLANSDIKKVVATLPQGFTTNPSLAEGLNVCTEADLARETVKSAPGEGCPNASKVGTVEVESPLLEENVNGSLFIAKPYENPFNSLLALYIVIKNPTLGIIVKQPLKVESDPVSGQITTVAENLPQLPFSHFKLHFREGTRSPLASPPTCGTYDVKAQLTPWAGGPPIATSSAFQIISGPGGGPCPTEGIPPFHPGLIAGAINNAAGHYSPFNVRLFRSDGEQEFTNFSIKLPPGISAKLAGVPFCPEAAIAAAKSRTGAHGGAEEIAAPSCPAASEVGHTLAGGGVGPSLAYAPGKLYLAGPYHGSALSLVSITAGKVGPFDLGTVVVRFALRVNPETAEVFVDATGSDPIPHIIKGIPIHLRDIRAYNDRPEFVLNPTSCKRTSTASTLLGSGLDFGSVADDQPVTVTTPFQAADCAALPFKPKLSLKLIGGTKRSDHPALRAELKARPGDANVAKAVVTLPHSEFLENAHIKTICTRVQFRAEQCPPGSVYGFVKATTPILDDPIEGPLYLRSSEHPLPDLVAHLKNGQITIDAVGRIDSVKGGGIRTSFETIPDAPIGKVVLTMQGASKGLLVNSTDLCGRAHRATVEMTAHSGRIYDSRPALGVKCGKKGKGKGKRRAVRRALGLGVGW